MVLTKIFFRILYSLHLKFSFTDKLLENKIHFSGKINSEKSIPKILGVGLLKMLLAKPHRVVQQFFLCISVISLSHTFLQQ